MQHVLDHLRETRTQLFALVQGLDEDGEPASPGARRRDPSPSPSPSRCGSEASDCSSTSESSDDDEQSVAASEPPAESNDPTVVAKLVCDLRFFQVEL